MADEINVMFDVEEELSQAEEELNADGDENESDEKYKIQDGENHTDDNDEAEYDDNEFEEEDDKNDVDEENEEDVENDDDSNKDEKEEKISVEQDEKILINTGETSIEVGSKEELVKLAEKSLKTKVLLDKYKDDIAIIEGLKENGIEDEDLYLLAEAKKGNKNAIAKLIAKANIDPLDIDPEEAKDYKPNEVKANMDYIQSKTILEEIQNDEDVYKKFNNLVMKDFDDESKQIVFKNPDNLEAVANIIKSGVIDAILPKYSKHKLIDDMKSIDALIKAYEEYKTELESKKTEVKEKIETKNREKTIKRKKASEGVKHKKQTTKNNAKPDFATMSEEEFEKYYNSLVNGSVSVF